jgi:hypothetical protein
MPEAMERDLKATARKRGYSKERAGAYVYGTMRKKGWKPKRERGHSAKAAGDALAKSY